MQQLNHELKRRIVEHLACYRTHAETAVLLQDEFGIRLTVRHIRAYDPSTFQFAGSAHWIDYHHLVREKFTQEISLIPIAHRAYRLRKMQQLFDRASEDGNMRQAAKLLEQAAKEIGHAYEKRDPRK